MMIDISWDMSEQTIVRKIATQPTQQTLPEPTLKKVKEGDRMAFHAHVNVESLPEGKHLKKATIFSNVPNGGTWELISDEGTAVGGRGTAPSPLMYFAAGLGLCLMSHVEMLAKQLDIKLDSVRLEQRSAFSTTLDLGGIHPKDVFGKGEHAELHLLIESSEPTDKLSDFVGWCAQACMALQTVTRATPSDVQFYINGESARSVTVASYD
ncbi:MAG: OsmC family protein [Chloroflexi bacterium AL-W]|nr:OsmC family protein [Chloroflexi bacterium AL-N1]NOK68668.1 OsmC family protein [Chloroflexi bacterium AL-N10]NOK76154.1 OsmC family protein [Chloroflexi bacterium AL-N5]NOK84209.1 OsmC family protein [Chloroflexi bacterium AL-W]NOK91292.1 OsmC family protein [Chloroflexi bacterium AL-N15]